jgi:hypothetical protein
MRSFKSVKSFFKNSFFSLSKIDFTEDTSKSARWFLVIFSYSILNTRIHPIPRSWTSRNQFHPRSQFHAIPEFRFDTISINARNWKEFLGIPTNSGITTYMDLITNDRSWLSIEFLSGIPRIGRTRNRSGFGRNSRNWKQFLGIPGIIRTRNRSGFARNSRNWNEFLGIPTNSGITTYMGLITNDWVWLSIEFR